MRLIDADELKRKVISWLLPATDGMNMVDADNVTVSVIMEIEEAPTIDPVKHGHWIIEDHYIGGGDIVRRLGKCSCCNCCNNLCGEGKYTYCPHCGAKMDEVSE